LIGGSGGEFAERTSLARLATESGGRFTEQTNDLSLAYARVQRDLACTYTVGFYLKGVEDDSVRDVTVKVRRPVLRTIHPSRYAFRSASTKRESMLRAAFLSPELFDSGLVRAHIFPIRPTTAGRWKGLLAISFPVPLADTHGADAVREFGAVLHDGPRVFHRFSRRIILQPDAPDVTSEPLITFLEPVNLEPRDYELSVVLSDPGVPEPHAAKVKVSVPEVPRKELFLVGPMLGRQSGPNLVVRGGGDVADTLGDEDSFEPLVVQQLDEPVDLVVLTQACYVGKKYRLKSGGGTTVARSLRKANGGAVGDFDPVDLAFGGESKVRCQNLVDVLPATSVRRGEFVFEARLESGRGKTEATERVRFAIGPALELPDDRPLEREAW
jgi:hypothetical protein